MITGINHEIRNKDKEKSFYLFECNKRSDSGYKFITFVYGDYKKQLKNLNYVMIFQVSSALPDEWNKSLYDSLRKKLISYEMPRNEIGVPVYRQKHKLGIWEEIMPIVLQKNEEYLSA